MTTLASAPSAASYDAKGDAKSRGFLLAGHLVPGVRLL
jgi:hypothetical protein